MWQRFRQQLAQPVDAGSLAIVRMVVGAVLAWEAWALLRPRAGSSLLEILFTSGDVQWNVPYPGFEWLPVWPEILMRVHVGALAVSGLLLAVGLFTRPAAWLAFFTYIYVFLLEATRFNNHYYLLCLMALLLAVSPCGRRYSLDGLRHRASGRHRANVPRWPIVLLRGQLICVYFFGGVAKLSRDWLIAAEPMQTQLTQTGFDPLPELVSQTQLAYFLSYTGLVYDLAIGFLLLVPRTRFLALALTVVFHGLNHFLLFDDIGSFPFLGIGATTVFLAPDWPARLGRWLRAPTWKAPQWSWFLTGLVLAPGIGALLGWRQTDGAGSNESRPSVVSRATAVFVAFWLAVQFIVPLRHYGIAGDAGWTGEGERFSWRMKARAKGTGPLRIKVVDSTVAQIPSQLAVRMRTHTATSSHPSYIEVYRHVEARAIDWAQLPEYFVCLDSLIGRRTIMNPASAAAGATNRSQAQIQRQDLPADATHVRTITLKELLDRIERLDDGHAPPHLTNHLNDARKQAGLLQNAQLTRRAVSNAAGKLQFDIHAWMRDARYGEQVREWLLIVDPLALAGAQHPKTSMSCFPDIGIEYGWPNQPPQVYTDFERLSREQWQDLPQIVPVIPPESEAFYYWNHSVDLQRFKMETVQKFPLMMHQYVHRVADLWQEEFGERPSVYVTDYVTMNHYRAKLLIDPEVDLAAVPYRAWTHNAWITPRPTADEESDD